jgi:hypothetical protein
VGQRDEKLATVPFQVGLTGVAGRATWCRHQIWQQHRQLTGKRPDQRRRFVRRQAAQCSPQQVHDRGERRRSVLGEAGTRQDAEAARAGEGRCFGDEARLAEAGLAGDQGDPLPTAPCVTVGACRDVVDESAQPGDRASAADEDRTDEDVAGHGILPSPLLGHHTGVRDGER